MKRGFAILIAVMLLNLADAKPYFMSFYGLNLNINVDDLPLMKLSTEVSQVEFNDFVLVVRNSPWDVAFDQLSAQADEILLDDFGRFNMYKKFVIGQGKGMNTAVIKGLVYVALRKDKLDAKLANNLSFMEIYIAMNAISDEGYSFLRDGKVYYSTNPTGGHPAQIQVLFDSINDNNVSKFDLNLKVIPKLGDKTKSRNLIYLSKNIVYKANVKYNEYYVNYLNDMPNLELGGQLLSAAVQNHMYKDLDDSIEVWTKTMNGTQKQNFLLSFVQFAFPYKADFDYRLREKRNTVVQSLADEFIDCEDKAVIFLFLVRRYTNTEGVLLFNKKEKHVNCALELPINAASYSFKYQGKKYTMAEPSFQGYKLSETDYNGSQILESKVIFKE